LAWRSALGVSRLVWLDRAGNQLKTVGRALFHPDGRLSPDGHRYAVSIVDPKQGVADIWILDLDRESSERVTFTTLDERAPVWALDGRTLFYRSDGGGGPPDIFRLRPGEERGSPFYQGPGVEEAQDFSPDGNSLLFIDYRQSADIRVLSMTEPPVPRPFVVTPFNERSPRFSPDGRWVAYQSDQSGRPEVYVRAFVGDASTMLVSRDGGTRPRWRRDGKELFFLAPGGKIMSVAMNGGAPAAAPRLLFQTNDVVDLEPAADGNRFIVQIEERSTEPPVHLLTNWPARLQSQR
jgi:Tol biopolymer transport system component